MKKLSSILFYLAAVSFLNAQTIENIRPEQDGDKLNITYRIGGSTDAQLFKIYFTCSMDGAKRFEPKAVIGDVGDNIRGGRSFYTIVWDVFEDVDEVNNPEFFIGFDIISDDTPVVAPVQTRAQEPVKEETKEPEQKKEEQTRPVESDFEIDDNKDAFKRNSFFGLNGNTGLGIPAGLSFGSLNNWGYYVVPLRLGIDRYYDAYWGTYEIFYFHVMAAAGATKHIVSAGGFYRLHGFAGIGGHIAAGNVDRELPTTSHIMLETGVINVVGPVEITAGFSYSIGYLPATVRFLFGLGFAF